MKSALAAARQRQGQWEADFTSRSASLPQWHVLTVKEFTSQGGADATILDDQSVLLSGKRPDKDTYVIEVESDLTNVTGFRLETLTDPS